MEIPRLNVPGITCDGWVITIRMVVGRLEGVNKISGEVKSRRVTVEYEPSTVTVEAIHEALKRVGYEATTLTWGGPGSDPGVNSWSNHGGKLMVEALLVACCLGIPIALGVLATLRKGGKGQLKQDTPQGSKRNGGR